MSKHSAKGSGWEKLRLEVLERDGYRCFSCGREATTADHIIARSKGGPDALWNLRAACLPCNSSKGDRELVRLNYANPDWLPGGL